MGNKVRRFLMFLATASQRARERLFGRCACLATQCISGKRNVPHRSIGVCIGVSEYGKEGIYLPAFLLYSNQFSLSRELTPLLRYLIWIPLAVVLDVSQLFQCLFFFFYALTKTQINLHTHKSVPSCD